MSLTWQTAHKHGASSLAQQFPSFQIHTGEAGGNVKVEARAPSGKVVDLAVADSTGVYTANFTPTEVGDWTISITYNGQHIQGSPFNVRVYDASQVKVYGLEGGAVGKTFSFSADCGGAGEGSLTVDILHNGTKIPVNIYQEGRGLYRVSFTPDGAGVYTIKVMFAGMEVAGSPYTLEIVDSSMVTASGEGLSSVGVHKMTSFMVNTRGAGGGDIRVNVTSPSGALLPCQVFNMGDETFRVEYTPTEVGEYRIEVLFFGKPISGSPFSVQVYDSSRIHIKNLLSSVSTGRLVEFDIDASSAGSGNLEIMVNDGKIPCSVQNRGNRQFHASFTPEEPIPHFIQMRFNGKDVPGSPWRVDVRGAANIQVAQQSLSMMPANRAASFEVNTGIEGGVLSAYITAPSGRSLPNRVVGGYGGVYRVEFTPTESGNHVIELNYDGMLVPGSPFNAKVFNSQGIQISPIPNGIVSRPVEFSIDVNQAGEGQLEIMVNRGSVPNSVRMIQKGLYQVSFVPRDTRPHTVEVKFNGDLAPGCPINVPILDASRVVVHGEGLSNVAVNRQSFFNVNTQHAGDADLSVRVTAPNGDLVPAKIIQQPDGDYKVEYSSKYTGGHMVEILYAGQPIMGSPFYVEIYDPNKLRIDGERSGMVGQPIQFEVNRIDAGKAELGVTVTSPSGRRIPYDSMPTAVGDRFTYVPQESGVHNIYITYGGLEVPGCPLRQDIADSALVSASGDGLHFGREHQPAKFYVDTKGARGDLFVQVDGPNSIAKCNIEPEGGGRYRVTYTPVEVGLYNITIKWNGREIAGSPFHPKIIDPARVHFADGWEKLVDSNNRIMLDVNERKRLVFDTRGAGPGDMTADVKGPLGPLKCDVDHQMDGRITLSFVPNVEGDYFISVYYADTLLPKSPFLAYAGGIRLPVDHNKVVLTGHGVKEAHVKDEAEFLIDGSQAGPGKPSVQLTGVKQDIPVSVTSLGGDKYKCTYTPQVPGAYLLHIRWSEYQVRGSPFKVNVVAPGDASKVICTGDGLKQGIMGKDIQAVIDTRRAGPGELTAQCMGPSKVAYCELFDHHNGTFALKIKPQEVGRHVLQVKYGGQHVTGSPFTLKIAGAPDASKVVVRGPGIMPGILANYRSKFICETKGAGAGQLTVRIRGPKGAFRVEMQRESHKDRTILCKYDPTEVGDYIIYVKWSGEHVPGSPFKIQIFDTIDELQHFLAENPDIKMKMGVEMNEV